MRLQNLAILIVIVTGTLGQTQDRRIEAPRFWNDRELQDWALPVVGLNVRPGHFSEKEYYAASDAEWVRTYPVYFPGREPAGYWDMIRQKKPEPLITRGARTVSEWVAAGKQVCSVATLEDWFDAARVRDDYVPTGFKGYKVTRRAVPGHEFGLKLSASDRAALIAFLRTL